MYDSTNVAALDERTRSLALPRLLSPEIAHAFLSTLWGDLLAQRAPVQSHQDGALRKNAIEIHGRNYAPLLGLHWGITPTVASLKGADLLPSFVFFRIYFGGDVCRVHSDRPACEVSLSLVLGLSDNRPWALDIGTRRATDRDGLAEDFGDEPYESYPMSTGDAVLYHGVERRHGRLEPNPNRWSAHVFMEWVHRDGPHRDEAFERLDLAALPRL
jgi:hypothetical protein